MKRFVGTVCAVAVLLAAGQGDAARAQNLIINGDFEAWDDPEAAPNAEGAPNDWIAHFAGATPTGPNFNQAVGLDGTGNSLQINPGVSAARGVYQDFTPLNTFEFSFDFAAEAPTLIDQQSLRVTLRGRTGTPGTAIANLRINANASGTGDFQMFGSGSWTTVAGGLTFSNFATETLAVYRATLSGVMNTGDSATLSQSIRVFDVTNDTLLVDEDLGTGIWQTTPTSDTFHRIFWESTTAVHASYRVDNVSLFTDDPLGLPGDYNEDGIVDAADYVLWRRLLDSVDPLPNDDNLGTPIGENHYALWRSNFGQSSLAAAAGQLAAVPEPSTAGLVLLALFGLAIGRTWSRG